MTKCWRTPRVLAVMLMLQSFVVWSLPARAELSRSDYEACQARDAASFRKAIEGVIAKALREELRTLDYESIVAIEWRHLKLDKLIDARVDQAVTDVREETSWGSLLQSLASQEQAQKLATAVAERVYRSDEMRKAIEALATGVGQAIGGRIELASQDATGPALRCLKAFLGPRYGEMISNAVTADAGSNFDLSDRTSGPEIGAGAVLKNSTSGITGVTILIVRRQMANMARRIGQRIAGSVLSRLVSVVAGGVGVVLIAKDVWDFRHGVLPIIADEMKSEDTKEKVRSEVARSISGHINDHLDTIAAASADQIVEIWQRFRRAHTKALALAEKDPQFRTLLDDLEPGKLARLDETISLILETEGEPAVTKRMADGTLETTVKRLPDDAFSIARETRSIETALRWDALAGDQLAAVMKYELFKRTPPGAFTQQSLSRLLALQDRLAIVRLAGLERGARDTLFELSDQELKRLARGLTEAELKTLASYLSGLNAATRTRVLAAVSEDPSRMLVLKSAGVRDAVVASRDQRAAIEMLLREGSGDIEQIKNDFQLAWQGDVAAQVIVAKHPFVLAMLVAGLVLAIMLVSRLFRPRGRAEGGDPGTPKVSDA